MSTAFTCGPAVARRALLWLVLITLTGAPGCSSDSPSRTGYKPQPPYMGPAFLRETVGAKARFYGFKPLLVSGYGLVVGLDGTGGVVPPNLRQRMLTMAYKGGYKRPEGLLASLDTAVVAVEGFIPPGATPGTRFDLLVSSLPQTQATSLTGGTLYKTPLSILGRDTVMTNKPLAYANGPIYINPFQTRESQTVAKQGVIIAAGVVKEKRNIRLLLRDPSFGRARVIADRINERFARAVARYANDPVADRMDLAKPKSDIAIQIHILNRYARQPARLLNLILHLHLGRGPTYEVEKAQQLADVLRNNPQHADAVTAAWEALGRSAMVVLRKYYDDPNMHLRRSALEAGVKLGDERSAVELDKMASHEESRIRKHVAELLVHLPGSIRGPRILHRLLDDEDRSVRLAAYESLTAIKDPLIQRTVFRNEAGFKFILDLVTSDKPLIYIAQSPVPRVAVFDPMLGFDRDDLISLWGNRLMLRRDGKHLMKVFYQKRAQVDPIEADIRPAVGNLVYLMGHHPTPENGMTGFDLHFGQIVNVLHNLCRQRKILADIELQINPLAVSLQRYHQQPPGRMRPEFGEPNLNL